MKRTSAQSQTAGAVIVAVQCMVGACSSLDAQDTEVTRQVDTTGLEYDVVCGSDGCDPRPRGEMECGDGLVLLGGATYLLVCASEGGAFFEENCRPVICMGNTDCRESFDVEYVCREGSCQRRAPIDQMSRTDVFASCLAGVSRSEVCQRSAFSEPDHEIVTAVNEACPIDPEEPSDACDNVPSICNRGMR